MKRPVPVLFLAALAAIHPAYASSLTANDDSTSTLASASVVIDVLANDSVDPGLTATMLGFARVTALYDAGSVGNPPDPATVAGGSWTVTDTEDGDPTTGNLTGVASVDHIGSGKDAWIVRDQTNSSGQYINHRRTLTVDEQTAANGNGWSLEAELHFIDDFADGAAPMLQYGNGTRRFLVFFDLNANDDLTASTFGTGGTTYTLTTGGTGADGFHTISMLYDPVSQTSSFVVDGVRLDAGTWTGQSSSFAGVDWGTGSSGGQGTAAFHRVKHQVFESVQTLASGAVASHAGGVATFDPNGGYLPLDVGQSAQEDLVYILTDGSGYFDEGALSVTVNGVDDDPVVMDDNLVLSGGSLVISVADDLLVNDSDPEGDVPVIDSFDAVTSGGGAVVDNGDGTLTYTPAGGFSGFDTFSYTIRDDGGLTGMGTVSINVSASVLKIFVLTGQSNSLGTLALSDLSMQRQGPGLHVAEQSMSVPFFWDNRADGTPAGDAGLGDSGGVWVDLGAQSGGYYPNNDEHWGPEIGFARMLWNAGYRDFAIVKASRGGGGNSYWVKNSADDHMYDHVVATVNAAVTTLPSGYNVYEIAGLLYLQGESNGATEADEADTRFDALLSNLEADLSSAVNLTGVFGEIGGGSTSNRDLTRTRQSALASGRADIGYASSAGMSQHDGLHYVADSQLLMGERMAAEMIGTGALGTEPLPAWDDLHAWFVADNGAQPGGSGSIDRWASLNNGSAARDLTRTVSGRPSRQAVTSGSGEARGVMNFDGSSDLWASSSEFGTLAGDRSVVLMGRLIGSDDGFLFDGATSTGRTRAGVGAGDWQAGVSTTTWDAAETVTTASTPDQWQRHVFTFSDDGGNTAVTHWVDGVLEASVSDPEVGDLRGFIVGSNGGSPFSQLALNVAEIAVYDKVLDAADVAALESVWSARWGSPTGPPFSSKVRQVSREIPRFGKHELLEISVDVPASGETTLDEISITLKGESRLKIATVAVYDGGSSSDFDPSGSILSSVDEPATDTLTFVLSAPLEEGTNRFWVAVEPLSGINLGDTIDATVDELVFSGVHAGTVTPVDGDPSGELTIGLVPLSVDVRTRGAHGLGANYRIPGIACDGNGVLHAVYDNRYGFGGDLPGDVDVAYNRSTDGGVTWEPQKIILDFDASVPGSSGNGVGDPCILWDPVTDTIWVAALWSFGNNGYNGSGPGTDPADTGQYVLTKSSDGGDTWSAPINITVDVKDEANWNLIYQGPGHGLAMRDGTLVFPSQYRDGTIVEDGINQVRSCSIFSTDHGATWDFGSAVPSTSPQTNEMTLCELDDGRILFSCRTPSGGGGLRAWAHYTPGGETPLRDGGWGTSELGIVNDLYQLPEVPDPVVQGSVIQWKSTFDGHPREWVLFANPATGGRNGMTLRVSADGGITWPISRLVYSGPSAYSSLCILPDNSIGLLFEKDGYNTITFVRVEEEWLLNPDQDGDSDTLPDAWEAIWGTDPEVPDADQDPDGDGMTNAEERTAGTDPLNAESRLRGVSFQAGATSNFFTWSSVPGQTYRLEESENLSAWSDMGTSILGTGSETTVEIPEDGLRSRVFFRAVVKGGS